MDVLVEPHVDRVPRQKRNLAGIMQTVCGVGGTLGLCVLALIPTLRVLSGGAAEGLRLSWDDSHGAFSVGVDPLSAFFLLPVLGLSSLAAVYGGSYLFPYRHTKSLGSFWFFFVLFVAGMIGVLAARTVFLFLLAWEIMSLCAYFLVTFEHEKAEVRWAGWIYLVATHLGVAFLLAAFVLLGRHAGGLEFAAFGKMPALEAGWSGVIFVLAVVGFGAKAGLVPFHVWLPEAHPAAPSHVSALMSGVMIKIGLYGLLRILTFLGAPAYWWGLLLAVLGMLTALIGIALAVYQSDVKRVLAYSSIENMGLITLALGVAVCGWASQLPVVAVLGLTAALLHVWNHALMKGLMFFAAGSVVHATGTRDMERLGGLLKRLPWTGNAMIVGAVAIAALPPLNGFVSKWLLYLSLMNAGLGSGKGQSVAALLGIGFLTFIGGLAALTFVRLIGVVLLGTPRSETARNAHESSWWMRMPMLVLAGLCLTAAIVPHVVVSWTSGVLQQVLGSEAGQALLDLQASEAPLFIVGNVNCWILIMTGGAAGCLLILSRGARTSREPTWGCGYAAPTERMQYTGRSFAEVLAEQLLPRFLRLRTTRQPPRGLFPAEGNFYSTSPDPISEKVYEPFFHYGAERFSRLRILQQGKVHVYLAYVFLTVVLALTWLSLRTWWRAG